MAHSGKVLVSVFREFSAGVVRAGGGVFAGGRGGLGAGLSFYEVWTLS